MKTKITSLILLSLAILMPLKLSAHCEIPCGIYDDQLRIEMIKEDIGTVEKSIRQIKELSKEETPNYNQIVRWVTNKDDHATKIQEVATQYFMFQRIKLTDDEAQKKKNAEMLVLLHNLSVNAMKAKQTTDLTYVDRMKEAIEAFAKLYLGENYGKPHHH